ncbi:TPR repeat-containing protein [Marinobacter daqiaonensis]|uniref:TPR repeat-containing protein n=1 Tax=Marinobacter daqiaonensis TaxID=650891 RepID=A0A1I6JWJ3_9GAMM|nr:tetratricopeptide repeat protein [Marinobacter daqiaonensis]SFR83327.1 TPR repeat-containing protein [Marinobacter daqiaonensis]
MSQRLIKAAMLGFFMAGLAGCASDIYVTPGAEPRTPEAPRPPAVEEEQEKPSRKLSEQPEGKVEPAPSPAYQEQGDDLSPAAASLIQQADDLMARGRTEAALSQLERAQRISPRSAQVYFKLSEAYVRMGNLGSAEQFTLKGLSLSGSNHKLQKTGWLLLADIRRERGNVAGAEQAERRAAQL